MNKALGIGVIGCGSVFNAYLSIIEKLDYHDQARIVMACDQRPEMGAKLAQDHGITDFTTDYRSLVENPAVDIVLILTSMLEHAAITRFALQAGKHVLVEKPFATDLQDGAELVELAAHSQGYLVAAPHVILSPTFQVIGRHIQAGDIGKPLSARARYGWSGPWWSKWFYQSGGGAIFDLAPYNLTSLTGLMGPARRVMAMTGIAIPERLIEGENIPVQVEDNAHILIDFGEAVFAAVMTGFTLQQYRTPAIEIYGRDGAVQMLGDDWNPNGYELWQNRVGAWQVFKETDPNWSWCDGLNHLVNCIHLNTPPFITPEHAYHVLEIMVKAQESGRDGQTKSIISTFSPPVFSEKSSPIQTHLIHDRTHD
jgi:predicted dehydrogenase